ncbi:MAG UNVERIFIED_CONTAM: Obg family GTPase CgtA [Anaerolineae bacterium]
MDDSTYRVIGEQIERAARMTYWEYEEAVLRFQKILAVTGITDALLKAGLKWGIPSTLVSLNWSGQIERRST